MLVGYWSPHWGEAGEEQTADPVARAGLVLAVIVASTGGETGFADLKSHLVGYLLRNFAAYFEARTVLDPGQAGIDAAVVVVVVVGGVVAAVVVVG